jgi:hypothetical protein
MDRSSSDPVSHLVAESRVFQILRLGTVVEIRFRGTHEWTHGNEMHRYVEKIVSENGPAAIVFNLLDYRYVFGNDVAAFVTAAYDREAKRICPVHIAAAGTTYTSLLNLFKISRIQQAFSIEFVESVEAAVQRLAGREAT